MKNDKKIALLTQLRNKNLQASLSESGRKSSKSVSTPKDEIMRFIYMENLKMAKMLSEEEYNESLLKILYSAKKVGLNKIKIYEKRDINENISTISYTLSINGEKIKLADNEISKNFNGELDYGFCHNLLSSGINRIFTLKENKEKVIIVFEGTISNINGEYIEEIKIMGDTNDFLPYLNDEIGDIYIFNGIIDIVRNIEPKDNLHYIEDIFKSGVIEIKEPPFYSMHRAEQIIYPRRLRDIEESDYYELNVATYEDYKKTGGIHYNPVSETETNEMKSNTYNVTYQELFRNKLIKLNKFNKLYELIKFDLNKITEQCKVQKSSSVKHKR